MTRPGDLVSGLVSVAEIEPGGFSLKRDRKHLRLPKRVEGLLGARGDRDPAGIVPDDQARVDVPVAAELVGY